MDYEDVKKELIFTAGEGVDNITCVNYAIINDNISEGIEDFRVTASTDDLDRLKIKSPNEVRVDIIDDDGKCSPHTLEHSACDCTVTKFASEFVLLQMHAWCLSYNYD